MKSLPIYSYEITKRINKSQNTDWTMVSWNDGSRSWRRVYRSRKHDRQFICNHGEYFKMKYDESRQAYSFSKIDRNEVADVLVDEPDEVIEKVEEIKADVIETGFVSYNEKATHPELKTILECVSRKIPVYLVGPAGTGKSTILRNIANTLGLNFYSSNAVQDEYKLTGYCDAAGDFHKTEFYKAFSETEEGGLFFIDEMDASIPSVLTLLNTAIANGYFEFPNGRKEMNKNFRVVAAGNTFGNGADESYTGRMVLDQATLDRFATIEFNYDYNIELAITKGNKWLVDFIHELRNISNRNGLRTTFSYRCLEMISQLEDVLGLEKTFKIVLFKGMDKDTINLFKTFECKTKYEKALEKLQESY